MFESIVEHCRAETGMPTEMTTINAMHAQIDAGHRAFGQPQSWSDSKRGVGGERLIADLLAKQANAALGGSVVFLGVDLGPPGAVYPHVDEDDRCPIRGFGGDIDIALFLREYQDDSGRYGTSRRGLDQDHLVLVDSKQYAGDWQREAQYDRAVHLIRWLRQTLSHPRLLGSGNDSGSLRISYHFAHTGPWVPTSWLRRVNAGTAEEVSPSFKWWNSPDDLVFESPVEVLLGQLSILLTFANPRFRGWVPGAIWSLLDPCAREPYLPDEA